MTKLAALGTILALAMASRAGAQRPEAAIGQWEPNECLATIPSSELTRVPVFVTVEMADGARHSVPPDLANTLQAVADRARGLVSNGSDTLPAGEPAITWRDLGGVVRGVWHRDGRLTSSVAGDSSRGRALLARAIDAARDAGDTFMIWPDTVRADSLVFYFSLVHPMVDTTGTIHAVTQRPILPVFSIAAPRQRSVAWLDYGTMAPYPRDAFRDGATGSVLLQFVVDTTGRADTTTFRDIWPGDRPRPSGASAEYYDGFLDTARRSIATARYRPARIGRCPVRQVVRQPFTFAIGH